MKSLSATYLLCLMLTGLSFEMKAQLSRAPGNGYSAMKRLEWYWESRRDAQGHPVNATALNRLALKTALKMEMSQPDERSFSGDWTFAGPATMAPNYYSGIGRVNRIAFHPTDTAIIYAGTAGGGLWWTPNHGTVWYPLSDHISVNNITGVIVHPVHPDTIYILTGDGETGGENGQWSLQKSSIGVLKTTDGGVTWSTTGLEWGQSELVAGHDLIVSPVDPDYLIVCSSKGLFISDDGAESWIRTYSRRIYTARFKPGNPSVLYAVGRDYLYWSADAGLTWQDSIQIPQIEEKSGRTYMDISANDPEKIFVIAGPASDSLAQFRGLFMYNENTGQLNLQSNTPNLTALNSNDPGGQSWYDLAVVCDPANSNRLMMGAVHMHRSLDAGVTWTEMEKDGENTWHDDIHYLAVSPLTGSLYAGTDGGIYYSPNFGDNWTYISAWMRITQYYRIAVSQTNPNLTIGGTQDNGTNMKTAQHTQFTKIYHKDGMDCAIHPLDDDLMIYSCQDGEFFLSQDGGASEDSLIHVKSLPASVQSSWVTPVAWDPNNADNIWIGYRPLYFSNDMGETFNPIADTIGGRYLLHIGTNNPDRIYAGDYYATADQNTFRLWSSDDGGNSWYPCHEANTFPDSTLVITALTTNPDNSAEVWISVGGWNPDQKVYRSLNGGVTWSNMTGNLPNTPVNAILYHDTNGNPDDAVYIGTDIGVFYRNNDLGNWKYYHNGLPSVEVTDLEISYVGGKIKAATYGRGIWQSDLFSDCAMFYDLDQYNQFTGQSYEFQASENIEAEDLTIDGEGSEVFYRAGDFVLLKTGFLARAGSGAFFKASTGPCGAVIED